MKYGLIFVCVFLSSNAFANVEHHHDHRHRHHSIRFRHHNHTPSRLVSKPDSSPRDASKPWKAQEEVKYLLYWQTEAAKSRMPEERVVTVRTVEVKTVKIEPIQRREMLGAIGFAFLILSAMTISIIPKKPKRI